LKRILFCLLLLASFGFAQNNHNVTLTWSWAQGTGDPATGFHVQRSLTHGGPYTVVGTIPVATETYLDSPVLAGTTYYYVVTAYNAGGDSLPSGEVACIIPFSPPAEPPTGLSGTVK
jgi:hypothetical protein